MKTVVIVGANRGIGLEFCRQYKELGNKVFGVCRTSSNELNQLNTNILEGIDVSTDACIDKIHQIWPGDKIDILIHNAGMLLSDNYESSSGEEILKQFEVNTLGPYRIVKAFEKFLGEGSKLGLVSSRVGSVTDNTSSDNYGYRISKAALNMLGKNLSIDLKDKNILVAMLHPGYVKTKMTKFNGLIEAPEAVQGLIKRMDKLSLENSGGFWHTNGEKLPW
ncbi:MAG: SDR family oxidoreductase [Bdellovibrionaceae bacterium]|jgi:NAD(P)-dependent dehydrogenase (short-subunit alcohol dehydrogenase family)|nr:SDR family oxidoreductase [Pseudobdellovibrionaceae bacterium]